MTVTSVVVLTSACAKTKSKPKTPATPVETTVPAAPAATVTDPAAEAAKTATPAPGDASKTTAAQPAAGTPVAVANNSTTSTSTNPTTPSKDAPSKGDLPSQTQYPSQNGGGSTPAPTIPRIISLSHEGRGCPQGTVGGTVSADTKAFTLTFSEFEADIGPKIVATNGNTSCLVGVEFYVPANMTFTLLNLDIRGFVDLQDKVKMSLTNRFYFAEQASKVVEFNSDLVGVIQDNFTARRTVAPAQIMWSPCGPARKQILYIDTKVALDNAANLTGSGLVAVDSIDGEFIQKLAIDYKPCAG